MSPRRIAQFLFAFTRSQVAALKLPGGIPDWDPIGCGCVPRCRVNTAVPNGLQFADR